MDTLTAREEFLRLILHNKGIIIKICYSYCPDKNDREDLAQEIIYQLWKSGKNFDPGYSFTTWMYRIALNVAISHYRKGKQAEQLISFPEKSIDIADKRDGGDEMEEQTRLLQQFIHELKELDRALILLYLESKTYREIADILGISETNTATRISRIKDKLKQRFSTPNK